METLQVLQKELLEAKKEQGKHRGWLGNTTRSCMYRDAILWEQRVLRDIENLKKPNTVGDKISYTISEVNGGGEWVQIQYKGTITKIDEKHITTSLGHRFLKTN